MQMKCSIFETSFEVCNLVVVSYQLLLHASRISIKYISKGEALTAEVQSRRRFAFISLPNLICASCIFELAPNFINSILIFFTVLKREIERERERAETWQSL